MTLELIIEFWSKYGAFILTLLFATSEALAESKYIKPNSVYQLILAIINKIGSK
jgi:hypothetical protein